MIRIEFLPPDGFCKPDLKGGRVGYNGSSVLWLESSRLERTVRRRRLGSRP
jgi:hypothetical protein